MPSAPVPSAPGLSIAKYAALFAREAREHLRAARDAVRRVGGSSSASEVDALFRSVHTVKGIAGAMSYASVEEVAHALEDVLGRLRDGPPEAHVAMAARIAAGVDALDDVVEATISPANASFDAAAVRAAVAALASADAAPEGAPNVVADAGGSSASARAGARALRVDVDALDRLLDLAGELTHVRERLALAAARSGDAALARAVADLGRVSGAFADEVRSVRTVSLAELLADLPRVVRQAARATGKRVALETSVGDVVADRAVIDALAEPLVHLLRNAVDHGVEAPDDRARAGKPAEGRVAVHVARDGNALLVRVEDDGRGVDRAGVVARARARGRLPARGSHDGDGDGDGAVDDATLLDCLALPGLTTAQGVGRVSGRGVGVDAALARVRALGGSLALRTAAGTGTCFTLRMPLSWAVVPALVVRAGGGAYALPLAYVRGTRDATPADAGAPTLAALLGAPARAASSAAADVVLLAPGADAPARAVTVDELVGARECVLKRVATPRGAFRIAAGATILDDGDVALVLDVPAVAGRPAPDAPAVLPPLP